MKYHQITASMAKDIAFKLGAVLNDEEATIFADGYNVALLKVNKDMSTALSNNASLSTNSPVIPDSWISCSERMPDREYVLAGDFSGTHYLASIPNVRVGIYADWFDDEKPCWDDGDGNDLHLKEVTHWMPLPAAPKQ
ncbi:TPA: DUF551 domain-containing protein [Salmonella enterica]|nr:DUF551 domain-containing protein [Salmonella enterica]HEA0265428.1 DUF551 domain-containing protein [Salmonella enterica]HEA0291922.1 DUF551 domain-containing protein [Salmonella enterica]HEA0332663.1 DUF551 domain-containing protein [Salmonella enterica]HEA0347563.1 DUF551 domain-containing protein [Salmonella enterica]